MPVTIKSYLDMQFDKPKLYLVSIINDSHIPWEFCMKVLTTIFHKKQEVAEAIAHEIVTNGEGFCGGYIHEIAKSKATIVEDLAKDKGYEIVCIVEEV